MHCSAFAARDVAGMVLQPTAPAKRYKRHGWPELVYHRQAKLRAELQTCSTTKPQRKTSPTSHHLHARSMADNARRNYSPSLYLLGGAALAIMGGVATVVVGVCLGIISTQRGLTPAPMVAPGPPPFPQGQSTMLRPALAADASCS